MVLKFLTMILLAYWINRVVCLAPKHSATNGRNRNVPQIVRASSRGFMEESFSTSLSPVTNPHLLSVAPMMDYTDRHQRRLQRLISKQAVLYTEMVTTNAIVRSGDILRFLGADFPAEEPLVLQLGGSDPQQMKTAAKMAWDYGYREININVGCPSEKVAGAGCFGAALMLNAQLVAELSLAVGEATGSVPATIKCRTGVDDHDSYEELASFIRTVSEVGHVKHFIIHARKAILNANFSPHDNRSIPPLNYNTVYKLINDFPHLQFTLNGGIGSVEEAAQLLQAHPTLHGIMVGRAVINAPYKWCRTDSLIYGTPDPGISRRDLLLQYADYAAAEEAEIGPRITRTLIKPILNLFHAEPKGKLFRNLIDQLLKDGKVSSMPKSLQGGESGGPYPHIPSHLTKSTISMNDYSGTSAGSRGSGSVGGESLGSPLVNTKSGLRIDQIIHTAMQCLDDHVLDARSTDAPTAYGERLMDVAATSSSSSSSTSSCSSTVISSSTCSRIRNSNDNLKSDGSDISSDIMHSSGIER
mmetsp:Transcript_3350/g.5211  ORF Transcript_3350/g.5211 Transcript_3350/m.5211 type:complete len:528 (+) Transcript_3350:99-1682(+)